VCVGGVLLAGPAYSARIVYPITNINPTTGGEVGGGKGAGVRVGAGRQAEPGGDRRVMVGLGLGVGKGEAREGGGQKTGCELIGRRTGRKGMPGGGGRGVVRAARAWARGATPAGAHAWRNCCSDWGRHWAARP
jgi:hypothetical protein